MSLFEFITVIIAVVLALSLGQLLIGVSALVKARRHVRGFLPHTIWLGAVFLGILAHWWAQWDFRNLEWTYPSFIYVVLGPTLLFFAVTLLIPERIGEGSIDLKDHFLGVRRLFMMVMLAFIVLAWFDGPLLQGQAVFGRLGWIHGGWIGALLVGISTDDTRANTLAAAAWVVLIMFAIVIRFFPGAFG